MSKARWVSLGLLALAGAASTGYLLQRQDSAALRREVAMLRQENTQVASLRAEHERLLAEKVSDAELARLRGDRAALVRLRGEIETMRTRADQMTAAQKEPAAERPPALILNVGIAPDGAVSVDGSPTDLNTLRQRLAPFSGSDDRVEFRVRTPTDTRPDAVRTATYGIVQLGKEMKLKLSVRFEPAAR
jgi:hypothetical protein